MQTKRFRFLYLCCLFLPSLTANADWTKIPSAEFEMKPYPEEGSAAFRKDFELLHSYQDSRDKASCALASRQEHPTFESMFEDKLSPLSDQEAQKSAALVSKVMKLALKVSNYHKGKFLRPRPYDTDTSLKPCVRTPGGEKSYPSSHSATSMAAACVLAEIFSDKKKEILAYGNSLGELRAIVGVHHPSDVAAGQKLGRDICARVLGEADFQSELKKLKD